MAKQTDDFSDIQGLDDFSDIKGLDTFSDIKGLDKAPVEKQGFLKSVGGGIADALDPWGIQGSMLRLKSYKTGSKEYEQGKRELFSRVEAQRQAASERGEVGGTIGGILGGAVAGIGDILSGGSSGLISEANALYDLDQKKDISEEKKRQVAGESGKAEAVVGALGMAAPLAKKAAQMAFTFGGRGAAMGAAAETPVSEYLPEQYDPLDPKRRAIEFAAGGLPIAAPSIISRMRRPPQVSEATSKRIQELRTARETEEGTAADLAGIDKLFSEQLNAPQLGQKGAKVKLGKEGKAAGMSRMKAVADQEAFDADIAAASEAIRRQQETEPPPLLQRPEIGVEELPQVRQELPTLFDQPEVAVPDLFPVAAERGGIPSYEAPAPRAYTQEVPLLPQEPTGLPTFGMEDLQRLSPEQPPVLAEKPGLGVRGLPETAEPLPGLLEYPEQEVPIYGKAGVTPEAPLPEISSRSITDLAKIKGQGGMINPAVFQEGFEKTKEIPRLGARIIARGMELFPGRPEFNQLVFTAVDKNGKKMGEVSFQKADLEKALQETDLRATDMPGVDVRPEHQGKGVASELYKFAQELGNDIVASEHQTPEGARMWQGFEQRGLAEAGRIKRQGGAFTPFARKEQPITKTFKSYEDFKKALPEVDREFAAQLWQEAGGKLPSVERPVAKTALTEYLEPLRPNKSNVWKEVSPELRAVPDIDKAVGGFQRDVRPGGALSRRSVNNPLYTWGSNLVDYHRKQATLLSEGMDKQLSQAAGKFKIFGGQKELAESFRAIVRGEVPESATGKELFSAVKSVTDQLYPKMNEAWAQRQIQMGTLPENVRQLPKLENYFPHYWEGGFGFKISTPDGRLIELVRQTNAHDAKAAMKWFKETLPEGEYQISDVTHNPAYESEAFRNQSGLAQQSFLDLLDFYGETDSAVQAARVRMDEVLQNKAYSSQAGKYRLEKRAGVGGWLGNEPWKSDADNARGAAKAVTRYIRDANNLIESQKVATQLKAMGDDVGVTHPNVMKSVQDYNKRAWGTEEKYYIGKGIDNVIDKTFQSAGFSKMHASSILSATKGGIQGLLLAFRLPFMLSNTLGFATQAGPEVVRIAGKSGKVPLIPAIQGVLQGVMAPMKGIPKVPGVEPQLIDYIKTSGLVDFTQADINHAVQFGYIKGLKVAKDALIYGTTNITEKVSRVAAFTTLTKTLQQAGVPLKDSMPIAHNIVDVVMGNYWQHNKPGFYGNMGILGRHLDTFMTYQHTAAYNLAHNIKQVVKNKSASDTAALLTYLGGIFATAGIVGMPFVKELDFLWEQIRDLTAKGLNPVKGAEQAVEMRTPSEWMYELYPNLSTGPLSDMLGADVSGSFSFPSVVDLASTRTLGGVLGRAWEIGKGTTEFGKYLATGAPSAKISAADLILPDIPGGRGMYEGINAQKTPEGGLLIEQPRSDFRTTLQRTPEQQKIRDLGMRELKESQESKLGFAFGKRQKVAQEALKTVTDRVPRALADFERGDNRMLIANIQQYDKLNPGQLDNYFNNILMKNEMVRKMSTRELQALRTFIFNTIADLQRGQRVLDAFGTMRENQ